MVRTPKHQGHRPRGEGRALDSRSHDLSIAEVAQVLGIPAGTVKSRLHHAKRQLRAVPEEMGYRDAE